MGSGLDKLLRFASIAEGGKKRYSPAEAQKIADEQKERAEAEEMARWIELRSTKRFLMLLEAQKKAHKQKRAEAYDNHLAMVAHSTWESALEWVDDLAKSFKAGQSSASL